MQETEKDNKVEQLKDLDSPTKWPSSMLIRSVSLTGIFVIMVVFSLYAAAPILIPITMAYCFNLLLSPIIRKLSKYRIPPPISAGLVVIAFLFISGFSIVSLSEPAEEWLERAPQIIEEVKLKVQPMLISVTGAQKAANDVDKIFENDDELESETKVQVTVAPTESRLERMLVNTSSALSSIGIVIVMLYFLLASGDSFLNKFVTAIPKFEDKRRAVGIIRDIQRDTSHYLVTRTLINIGLGAVISLTLYALGMPNPILWGAIAAVLNFAPYIGPAISLLIIMVAAIISMDTLGQAFLMPSVVLLINIIEGELISHMLIGRRLSLSPLIVFTSIVFWGWLWGIPGALMAIPIIAAFNVICQHIESLRPLSDFISSTPRR